MCRIFPAPPFELYFQRVPFDSDRYDLSEHTSSVEGDPILYYIPGQSNFYLSAADHTVIIEGDWDA
jgi:hypothetical protein